MYVYNNFTSPDESLHRDGCLSVLDSSGDIFAHLYVVNTYGDATEIDHWILCYIKSDKWNIII